MNDRPGSSPLRVAGEGRLADGVLVTWVVSEGRRGRRWREMVREPDGSAMRSSLLYETDPVGRFSHLELSTPAGLATLHPEGDGTLHGNVVTPGGVRHVVGLPCPAGSAVLVAGSPTAAAAAMSGVDVGSVDGDWTETVAPFAHRQPLLAVVLDAVLVLTVRELVVTIAPDGRRSVDLDGGYLADADGAPVLLEMSRWPLELDGPSWTDRGQTSSYAQVDRETRG